MLKLLLYYGETIFVVALFSVAKLVNYAIIRNTCI